jgi:hypothetical protein
MLTLVEEQKQNEELARQINREARANPNSPYAGKWVGLLSGQVVVVANTLDEAVTRLTEIESERFKGTVFEASADYDAVQEIWRLA